MLEKFDEKATVVTAENAVLGRLASVVAKRLLDGESIIIVNADKGLISGNQRSTVTKYHQRIAIKTKSNPLKGPFYPRQTDQIVKRTIRGMLPFKKSRGKEAYSRLRVFKNIPDVLKDKEIEIISESQKFNPKSPYLSLNELQSKI